MTPNATMAVGFNESSIDDADAGITTAYVSLSTTDLGLTLGAADVVWLPASPRVSVRCRRHHARPARASWRDRLGPRLPRRLASGALRRDCRSRRNATGRSRPPPTGRR